MREPPPKRSRPAPPPSKRRGGVGDAEFESRFKRFKDAVIKLTPTTGVTMYDEAKLVQEVYRLVLAMSIFTKRGGPWYSPQDQDYPTRSLKAVEMMEEVWL